MNLPEPQSVTFQSLLGDIEKGIIKIPQFQRGFVWTKVQSARLLDSIIKGYPIGTFILWKTREELRSIRDLGGFSLPATPSGDYSNYVLDGQQRLTSLFASLRGLKVFKGDREEDYSDFLVDLEAAEDEPVVVLPSDELNGHSVIRLQDLLYGKIKLFASYNDELQDTIQGYKDKLGGYQFSAVLMKDAPIEVATEVFTRLNVGGQPLTVFEVMVAKTFDAAKGFDLAEKSQELEERLQDVHYETVSPVTVLQLIAILLTKTGECRKKDILGISKKDFIDAWPRAVDALESAIDYFRDYYRIPVSRLLPYSAVLVPFGYYFAMSTKRPEGRTQELLDDFFWRVSLGGRYSSSLESRLSQDIKKMDKMVRGKDPDYEWAVNVSPEFVEANGWFSTSRSYIKAMLCILAFQQPRSFHNNAFDRIGNDWLKQANSKNYHHFFPRAYMRKKQGRVDERRVNHIANITIVDDSLNKREIGAKAPSEYIAEFVKRNSCLEQSLASHLIDRHEFGVMTDDYELYFRRRCAVLATEASKRIIARTSDSTHVISVSEMDTDEPV